MNSKLIMCFFIIFKLTNAHKHSANPLLLLVSFDGFRWDYFKMYDLPNLSFLKSQGSHATFVKNNFVTATFPNHWSLVTGLYEESHGILSNKMYDPMLNKSFKMEEPTSHTAEWFGQNRLAEPIWVTNQKEGNGRKSVSGMPGSDVVLQSQKIINIKFNQSADFKSLINRYIELFTNEHEAVNFGALYFFEPGF